MKRIASLSLVLLMILMFACCQKTDAGTGQAETANNATEITENATETTENATETTAPETGTDDAAAESTADAAELVADTEAAGTDANIDYTTGTPWLDIDLDGNVTEDTPTDLKDNFALAVNKEKILETEIPEGYPYGGTIMDVVLQNNEDLRNMFLDNKAESHDAKLALTLFELMMDWDSRNAAGVAPLKEQVDEVEALDSVDALTAYLGETPVEKQLCSLWTAGIEKDFEDSSKYVLYISTGSLLLDDSAEYKTLTDYGKIKKEAKTELAKKMLVKLGYSEEEAMTKIDNCISFETELSESICTNEEQNKPDYLANINNHYSREELIAEQQKLPILTMIEKALGFPEVNDYVIYEPAFIKKLDELYTEENLATIKDYMIVHGAVSAAGSLDRECYEWQCEASNKISGSTGMLDDATVFASKTASILPWPVSRLYTETYLKEEDKARVLAMIDEIIEAYHGIIEDAEFLSETTSKNAIEKLDALGKNVLYPDSWEKYSYEGLDIASPEEGGTLWEALTQIGAFATAKDVKDYQAPIDKEKWAIAPHIVNCFYYPLENKIYILGALAQGNIYNSDMSDEELYAKLGTIIGHEISHAFDSSGSQFDKDGNMADWWEEEDRAAFQEKNEKMVAYYNAIHPWEGQDLYGSIMTGEACADMGGMRVVLNIVAEKENFDYDKFFRSYADVWLTKDSLGRQYTLVNNTHPMNYLRINATLQQYDEFLDFYGITEGDDMYLAPEDRVAIW